MTDFAPSATDPTAQGSPAGAPASPPEPPAAPAQVTITLEQARALIDQAVAAALAGAGALPAAPTEASPVRETRFSPGQTVTSTWVDPYTGKRVSRTGVVLQTLPADPDDEGDPETGRPGSFARSIVGWFHEVSGPIGDHLLTEAS